MITKKELFDFITAYQNFDDAITRIEEAISGSKYGCNLFASDWYDSVGKMLDVFLESHFSNHGRDLIYWWLFEDVDKIIYQKVDPDLFNGETEVEYNVENFDDLWIHIIKHKEDYFKND